MALRRICLFALSLLVAAAAEPDAAAGQPPAAPAPGPPSTAAPPQPSVIQDKKIPVNPIAISFEASLDHDATDAKGPKVLKYVIEFVPVYSEGERKELDLGKPKPVDGQIVVPLKKAALKPGRYAVSVRAFGRTAESSMTWVGPFDIVDPNAPPKPEAPAGHDHHGHGAPAAAPPASTPPPPTPPPSTPPAPAASAPNTAKPESDKPKPESDKPAEAKPAEGNEGKQKRGFWRKFYDKIVGSP